MKILDNNDLLSNLVQDLKKTSRPWKISSYWEPYHHRHLREIRVSGISNLASNHLLQKGFGIGRAVDDVIRPSNALKRFLFNLIISLPLFSKVVNQYYALIRKLSTRNINLEIEMCKQALISIEKIHGPISLDSDLTVGGAKDVFKWRETLLTTSFVKHLIRVSDFYKNVNMSEVTSLVEIGQGLGWSTLAHKTLNPNLKLILNIDIPTTTYLSTQFLKASGGLKVFDYNDFLKDEQKIFDLPSKDGCTCILLPTWCYTKIEKNFDWFYNAYSFKEMDQETVEAYIEHTKKIVSKGAWIISSVQDPKTESKFKQIDVKEIIKYFSSSFSELQNIDYNNSLQLTILSKVRKNSFIILKKK